MGKGRAPCCEKSKVKRGPWSPSEDLRLIAFIQKHGHHNWRALPKQAGLLRCGKSCRLRWINYLRPDVKRGNFTKEEEDTIINLHQSLGNKWSKIASYLPGRTDNEIKNLWNTHLKKRTERNSSDMRDSPKESSSSVNSSRSSSSLSSTEHCDGSKDNFDGEEGSSSAHDETNKPVGNKSVMMPIKEPSSSSSSSSSISYDIENLHQADVSKCGFGAMLVETNGAVQEVNETHSRDSVLDHHQMDIWCEIGGTYLETSNFHQYRQTDMPCEFGRMDSETKGVIQEVNEPDSLQVPLESDIEFWNRLDGIGTLASSDVHMELPMYPSGTGYGSDHEYNEWMEYLEDGKYYDYSLLGAEEVDRTRESFLTSHSVLDPKNICMH